MTLAALLWSGPSVTPAPGASHRLLDSTEAFSQLVANPRVSADGQWVIYDAVEGPTSTRSLFSTPVDGGDPIRLVEDFAGLAEITADSARVVYQPAGLEPGEKQLFSVPVDGGVAVQLNPPLGVGGEVNVGWQLTDDGQRVIFRAKQHAAAPFELFSVGVMGGPVTRLNGDLAAGGEVMNFSLRPGGSMLIYQADQQVDNVPELFTVAVTGGVATRLNGPLVAGGSTTRYGVSADDTQVFYIADQETDGVFELYRVALTGAATAQAGAVTKLNPPLVSGGDVKEAAFSPDGTRVVYAADGDVDQVTELYSVPSGGGTAVKVNGPLVAGGNVLSFPGNWRVGPSGRRVVYRADQETDGIFELYSAALTGGDVHKLTLPMGIEGAVESGFEIRDGRVVMRSDAEVEHRFELYSAPLGGGPAVKLNAPLMVDLVSFGTVDDHFVVASGEVYFQAPIDDFFPAVYRVPIAGGVNTRLTLPARSIEDFLIGPGGTDLFYTAPLIPGLVNLYRRPATVAGATVQLNGASTFERGRIEHMDVDETAGRVIYTAHRDVLRRDLFSLPLAGGVPVQLNTPHGAGGEVEFFELSPEGQRVIYAADQDIPGKLELYSVPVVGGAAVKLNLAVADGGGIVFRQSNSWSPDGSTVVYRAFQGSPPECEDFLFSGAELFSVPAVGGTPQRLHPPLDPCVQAFDFVISPAGDRVIYSVQDTNALVSRLMSVPLGGGASVQLGPDFRLDFYEDQLKITPDGSTLVYRAAPDGTTRPELFSIPVTGGQPMALIDPFPASAAVRSEWNLSPDGSRVVYLSDVAEPGRLALSSVAVSGGPSTDLSGKMVAGGNVVSFVVSSAFGRVVFLADRNIDDVLELFSVSLAGGTVTQLNASLGAEQRISEFAVSDDSNHVVYRVRDLDGEDVLWRVSLAGGAVTRLSHGLTGDESIESFVIDGQSRHVVYRVRSDALATGAYYRVPIVGGGAVRFSSASVTAEGALDQEPSPTWLAADGSMLLYGAGAPDASSTDLWLSEEFDLFLDGFESGDTSRWSTAVP